LKKASPFYQKLAPFPKGVHSASLPFFAFGEEGEEARVRILKFLLMF
jgi:hypothetical protein